MPENKEIEIIEPVVTITSTLNEGSTKALETLAEALKKI